MSAVANRIPTAKPVTHVHDRAEDRPWESADAFLIAVREAGIPGGTLDQRLRASLRNDGGDFVLPPPLFENRIGLETDDLYVLSTVDRRTVEKSYEYIGVVEDESSQANGERLGGLDLSVVPDGEEYPYTTPKLRQIHLDLRPYGTIVPVTNSLLEAAPTTDTSLSRLAMKAVAFMQADKVWNGTGVGQPLGVRNSPALIPVAIEASQTIANTATYIKKNAANMVKRAYKLGRHAFYVHPQILADAIDADILGPVDDAAPFGRLATRPIFPNDVSPAVGTVGDFVLANMSDYVIAERALRRDVSIHVRFEYDESLFRFTKYYDGQPSTSGPITPFAGTDTKSPIVALAARS